MLFPYTLFSGDFATFYFIMTTQKHNIYKPYISIFNMTHKNIMCKQYLNTIKKENRILYPIP